MTSNSAAVTLSMTTSQECLLSRLWIHQFGFCTRRRYPKTPKTGHSKEKNPQMSNKQTEKKRRENRLKVSSFHTRRHIRVGNRSIMYLNRIRRYRMGKLIFKLQSNFVRRAAHKHSTKRKQCQSSSCRFFCLPIENFGRGGDDGDDGKTSLDYFWMQTVYERIGDLFMIFRRTANHWVDRNRS